MMHPQPANLEPHSRPQRKTNRRRSTHKANNTNALQTSLEAGVHTLSLSLLPVTVLVLLWMVAMGMTGNSWFAFQPTLRPKPTMASGFTPRAQPFKLQPRLELLRPNVTIPIAGQS